MARESYEVYYNQNGRWQLHGSYEPSEREKAVEEAKSIEAKEGFPTRVIRETFSDETNTSEEIVTWQSAKAKNINDADSMFGEKKQKGKPAAKKRPPPPPPPPRTPEPKPEPKPDTAKPEATPKPKAKAVPKARKPKGKKKRSGLVRFLMALLISAALAIVSLITGSLVVFQMVSMGMLPAVNYSQLIGGAAVLVFFIALFINLQRQFNIMSALRGKPKQQSSDVGPAQMMSKTKKKPQPVQDIEFDQVEIEDLRDKIDAEDAAIEIEEELAETEPEAELPSLDADMGGEVYTSAPLDPEPAVQAPVPEPVHAKPEPVKHAPPQHKPEEKKPAPKPAVPEKSPAENEARASFSKFISDASRTAKPEPTNAFSKFGMNLYFAGGASVIGQSKRLPKDVQLAVLKDGLISAGNTPERAENFCVELPTYGKNPRYTVMVQAGAKAMTQQMSGAANATAEIGALLSEWNLPEKRPTVPSVFTFVFTDIVGSTAMTQKLGNAGAQKAVRAHNTAVRGALQAHKGREVKHTGDGIMAVFPDPVSAVQATIRMQRDVFAHNAANPNIEVMVRIGVNVGEAVEEDNDFFGAAVQMTARICDKATKGNIWVSQAVKDACKGQKVGFIPRGKFEMKGIQGSKPLYEIGWSDAHKNELADL